jgi:hypothetical protein
MSKEQYIRASEIGSFVFCERAWSYARKGIPPTARLQASREAGRVFHKVHGTRVILSRNLMTIGLILLVLALVGFYALKSLFAW